MDLALVLAKSGVWGIVYILLLSSLHIYIYQYVDI